VADQNRRAGAAFDSLENVIDIIGDAEVMEAVAPFAPAVSAQGDRMRFIAARGEPRQEFFGPDPGAAESAMDERSGTGLAGPVGDGEKISRFGMIILFGGETIRSEKT